VSLAPPAATAAWYPDPTGRHEFRFWSGANWTDHVADGGQSSADPIVARLLEPNTPRDWIKRRLWTDWPYPENAIRGESQHQDEIIKIPGVKAKLLDERADPVVVEFVREPDNPYDRLACQALVGDILVGHLAREWAAQLAPQVDAAGVQSWQVAGLVVGGVHGATMFGVHVWLDRRLTRGPEWVS
jgi:hypothetical protein